MTKKLTRAQKVLNKIKSENKKKNLILVKNPNGKGFIEKEVKDER